MAYLLGTEPALVRLQFLPVAAGKAVILLPGPGVIVDPLGTKFQIGPTGEVVVSVALDSRFHRSDINVDCVGIRTKLPLSRASREFVEAREAETGGMP